MSLEDISHIIVYLCVLYAYYLLGVLISKCWLVLRAIFLLLFIGAVVGEWERIGYYYDYGVFFNFIVPFIIVVYPSFIKTFQNVRIGFNPLDIISSLADWNRRQKYQAERRKREREKTRPRQEEGKKGQQNERQGAKTDDNEKKEQAKSELERAYEVLGVTKDMSFEEMRSAYLDLIRMYAPDRVSHLAPEFQQMAHQKSVEINRAWERVKANQGFS